MQSTKRIQERETFVSPSVYCLFCRHTQTAMSIMNHEITAHGSCCEIINTASTIRNITHDHCFNISKSKQKFTIMYSLKSSISTDKCKQSDNLCTIFVCVDKLGWLFYLSRMSAMVQAYTSKPSGNCSAT